MKFLELVKQRQSVRRFSSKQVDPEKLNLMLEAARLAPSACNSQPWHFIVVDKPELKQEIAKATYDTVIRFNRFALQAAGFIVIVMEKPKIIAQIGGRIKSREYPLYDIGITAEHICLQATELGIGTCMIGWFDEKKIMELLHIPPSRAVGLIIAYGYPEEGYKLRTKIRKKWEEVVSYNIYKTNKK